VSTLLAHVTTAQRCTGRELAEFAGEVGPWLLRLTEHATRYELAVLHSSVETALSQLTAEQRSRLEIVVAGAHRARARSLALQYFQRRLGDRPDEERRVASPRRPVLPRRHAV
jgi:hypothetical protein